MGDLNRSIYETLKVKIESFNHSRQHSDKNA